MATKLRQPQTPVIACSVCQKVWYEGERRDAGPDHVKVTWKPVGHRRKEMLPECPKCEGSLVQR